MDDGCISDRLVADRVASADGLRSDAAAIPDTCCAAVALECSDSVGVECEGTGGDESEKDRPPWDPALVFIDVRPTAFTVEGDVVTAGRLHCSDTHCPGGLVFRPDGDEDPVLNFSRPRPRLWPTAAAATATKHNIYLIQISTTSNINHFTSYSVIIKLYA